LRAWIVTAIFAVFHGIPRRVRIAFRAAYAHRLALAHRLRQVALHWKKIHFTACFGALVMLIHGTLIDPNLKGQPPDSFDGEKVLVEECFLLVVAAAVWRVRQKKKPI
jgi:hypothetical protein